MGLNQRLEEDLITSMKARDAEKTGVLRMVKAALTNYKIEKKKENLDDSEVLEVIQKQAKQRNESIDSFQKAGRTDLVNKEKAELAILAAYLPAQMSDEELRKMAQEVIASVGAKTKVDAGKVMKDLMPLVKGRADGKRAQEIATQLLA